MIFSDYSFQDKVLTPFTPIYTVIAIKFDTVRGCTALIDALGGAIHHIGNVHKYARPEDVPAHTMFIITTDGMENASRKYTSERVKQMIERQKERYGSRC